MSDYTPRYQQFARVRGFEPGSKSAPLMYEYISWIRSKWGEWAWHTQRKGLQVLTPEDHAAFDEWLSKEAT